MDTKAIIDIQAFTDGVTGVMNSTGLLIPFAIEKIAVNSLGAAIQFPYSSALFDSLLMSWQFSTFVSSKR
jgi:hypothetical protein